MRPESTKLRSVQPRSPRLLQTLISAPSVCLSSGHCASHSLVCVYGSDGRKVVSAHHVNALKERITILENVEDPGQVADLRQRNETLLQRVLALERALNANGISVGDALSTIEPPPAPASAAARRALLDSGARQTAMRAKRPSSSDDDIIEVDHDEDDVDWSGAQPGRLQRDGEDGLIYFGSCGTLQHASTLAQAANSASGHVFSIPTSPPTLDRLLSSDRSPFDWSRHLPPNLFSHETHDDLLDLFDSFFGPWCCVINMDKFRADMHRCLTDTPSGQSPDRAAHYSPMLHNALLAIALTLWKGERIKPFPSLFATRGLSDSDRLSQASQALYDQARHFMESEMAKPVESTVRAMLLLASWNASKGTATLGYIHAGTAFRMCSVLGLNINCTNHVEKGIISDDVKKSRFTLFNCAFIQERVSELSQLIRHSVCFADPSRCRAAVGSWPRAVPNDAASRRARHPAAVDRPRSRQRAVARAADVHLRPGRARTAEGQPELGLDLLPLDSSARSGPGRHRKALLWPFGHSTPAVAVERAQLAA